ncbi:MAG: DUF1194 domain-containing protein [Geminicoccaceae bacterium]|nr:DUF1194 domain-containing protein [Geminicoccaceae bacterium]
MTRWLTLVLLLMIPVGPILAQQRVDLELVLLADASGSIDDGEIRFQRQGYASAITHPDVLDAIAMGYDQRIAVTYVEWGQANSQEVVVPWTIIGGKDDAGAFAEALMTPPRRAFGRNSIGNAIAYGQALLESNDIEGTRKVIDISADSANNWNGLSIAEARAAALAADITINGLAVLCRSCSGRPNFYDLEQAFAETIIGGPASFVVTADDDASFADAVRRKLLLEIAGRLPSSG